MNRDNGPYHPEFVHVTIRSLTGKLDRVQVALDMSVEVLYILTAIAITGCETNVSQLRLFYREHGLDPRCRRTLTECGIKKNSTIDMMFRLLGGKPVIYILPPVGTPVLDARIDLRLEESWTLSALWPVPPSSKRKGYSYGQKATWNISATSNALHDKESGIKVSYLYWEAT